MEGTSREHFQRSQSECWPALDRRSWALLDLPGPSIAIGITVYIGVDILATNLNGVATDVASPPTLHAAQFKRASEHRNDHGGSHVGVAKAEVSRQLLVPKGAPYVQHPGMM